MNYVAFTYWNKSLLFLNDGKYILTAPKNATKEIELSSDFGVTFTDYSASTQNEQFRDFSINKEGNLFVTVSLKTDTGTTDGSIFKSTNGTSWSKVTAAGSKNWNSIDISSDGSVWCAAVSGGSIYHSIDSGTTFTEITGVTKDWNEVRIAKLLGDTFYATVNNTSEYLYKYSGGTMVQLTGAGQKYWVSVGVSDTGQYVLAFSAFVGVTLGQLWLSTDYGVTFNQVTNRPVKDYYYDTAKISVSSTGQYMLFSGRDAQIVSQDYGASWFNPSNDYPLGYNAFCGAVSQSGQYMILGGDNTYFAQSSDYGDYFGLDTTEPNRVRISICYNR